MGEGTARSRVRPRYVALVVLLVVIAAAPIIHGSAAGLSGRAAQVGVDWWRASALLLVVLGVVGPALRQIPHVLRVHRLSHGGSGRFFAAHSDAAFAEIASALNPDWRGPLLPAATTVYTLESDDDLLTIWGGGVRPQRLFVVERRDIAAAELTHITRWASHDLAVELRLAGTGGGTVVLRLGTSPWASRRESDRLQRDFARNVLTSDLTDAVFDERDQ